MRQCPEIWSACWCAAAFDLVQILVFGDPPGANSTAASRRARVDPLKQWKLSPIDRASFDKWDDYTEAKEAMFFYTDTADAPWTIVKSNDKKRARLNCMQHFLSVLPYPEKDKHVVHGADPLLVGSSAHVLGNSEHILGKSMHPDQRRTTNGAP